MEQYLSRESLQKADKISPLEHLMAKMRGETVLSKQRVKVHESEKRKALGLRIKNGGGEGVTLAIQVIGGKAFLFNPATAEPNKPVSAISIESDAKRGAAVVLSANLNLEIADTLGLTDFPWGDRRIMIGLTGNQQSGFDFEMNAQGFAPGEHPRIKPESKFARDQSLITTEFVRKPIFETSPSGQLQLRHNPRLALPDVGRPNSGAARAPTQYLGKDTSTQLFYCEAIVGGQMKQVMQEFPVDFNQQLFALRQERRSSQGHEPKLFLQHVLNEQTFLRLISQQEIQVGPHKIRREALSNVVVEGRGRLTKFSAFSKDVRGHETRMVFLPVLTEKGDVVILQLDLESYGKVKDALSTISNGNESRLAVSQNFQLKDSNELNPRYVVLKTGEIATKAEAMYFQEAKGTFHLQEREFFAHIASTNGDRKIDEDLAYCVLIVLPDGKEIILFGVNDGMGGHDAGDKASVNALSASYNWLTSLSKSPQGIQEYVRLRNEAKQRNIPTEQVLLEHAVKIENEVVHSWNQATKANAGTTRTGGIISGDWLFVANAGDSRTYLRTPDSDFRKITTDHSLVASLAASGQIKPEEILTNPQRNQVYRSVGDKPNLQVDIETHYFPPGSSVFFCCDGFWEGGIRDIDGARLTDLCSTIPFWSIPEGEAVSELVHMAANSETCDDNVSAGIIRRIK